jgi:hypothetical protein
MQKEAITIARIEKSLARIASTPSPDRFRPNENAALPVALSYRVLLLSARRVRWWLV